MPSNLNGEDANSKPAIPCKNGLKARLIGVSRPEPGSGHRRCRLRCATGMPVDVIETQYREDQGHTTWHNYDQRHYSSHSAMPLDGSKSPHSPRIAHGSSRARRHPTQGHRRQSDRQPSSRDSPLAGAQEACKQSRSQALTAVNCSTQRERALAFSPPQWQRGRGCSVRRREPKLS